MSTAELCLKHNPSQRMFYTVKQKFGGAEVSKFAKLKAIEDARPSWRLADTMLGNTI